MLKNTETRYGVVAKSFHWLLFLMLSFSIVAGNFLAAMPKGVEKLQAAGLHKSFGVVLLLLILARLLWRLINVTPEQPDGTAAIQGTLARGMHWVLYALMFAQPLSGILMSQASGYPVSVFGAFELPMFLQRDPSLAQTFLGAHGVVWILLILAVIGHAGAAMYHHFVRKDDVLRQMALGTKA